MFVVKVLCLYPLRNFFLHFVTKSIVIHTCMTRQKSTLSSETPLNRCSVKKTAFRCVVIFKNDNLDPVAKLNNLYIVHCCNLCTFSLTFDGLFSNYIESTDLTGLHVLTQALKRALVTMIVTFPYMENWLFLMCNILIDNNSNLRNLFPLLQ